MSKNESSATATVEKKNVIPSKRFVVRKNLLGKGATIHVTFKDGREVQYDHDAVYEANKAKFEEMPCFQKYKTYTATNSIPTWAREIAEELKPATAK